jgi:hypothetical protein
MDTILITAVASGIAGLLFGVLLEAMKEQMLQSVWGPEIDVWFDGKAPECNAQTYSAAVIDNVQYDIKQRYVRIRVTNPKPRTAKNCRGFLVGYQRWDGNNWKLPIPFHDSIPLVWSFLGPERVAIDLPKGVPHYLNLFHTSESDDKLIPEVTSWPNRYEELLRTPSNGRYLFDVVVTAEHVEPQRIQIDVDYRHWSDFVATVRHVSDEPL